LIFTGGIPKRDFGPDTGDGRDVAASENLVALLGGADGVVRKAVRLDLVEEGGSEAGGPDFEFAALHLEDLGVALAGSVELRGVGHITSSVGFG
jgi:hypothetical protein